MQKSLRALIVPVILVVASLGLAVMHAAPRQPGDAGSRFPLGSSGILVLDVPSEWSVKENHPIPSGMPALEFSLESEPGFLMTVTPSASSTGDPGFTDPRNVRSVVERRAAIALGRSAKSGGQVVELQGAGAHGFYYQSLEVTQSAGAGRWLTTGIVIVGPLLLATDIRSAQSDSVAVRSGIAMLKTARQLPPEKTFDSMSPGRLIGSRMVSPVEEVSFAVPGGWVVDDRVPMGIRHEASGATFSVFHDDLVTLAGDLHRAVGENVAPDTSVAVQIHKRTLRDSLGCDYTLLREGPRQVGRIRFRELVLETAPADGAKRHVRELVAWYRARAFILRFTVPTLRAEDSDRFLDELLGTLNLKDRG